MEIQEILSNYQEVCRQIGAAEYFELLNSMQSNIEDGRFYLPFIGQFSAGKSKLINRLLGKEILPTKTVETTAFLTQIEYSEEESAMLYYEDGTYTRIAIEKVHELDHDATKSGKAITSLRISLPLEILKSGVVLVDTPGVNTLINKHVEITEELLSKSQYIVYVFQSSLTQTDIHMIEKIEQKGIPMLFVRTHIDAIDSAEEDVTVTLKNEHETLNEKLGRIVDYFPMCNNSQKNEYFEWEESYMAFFDIIKSQISNNIKAMLEKTTRNRLAVIQADLQSRIDMKIAIVRESGEKDCAELEKELQGIRSQRNKLEDHLTRKTKDQQCKSAKVKGEVISSIENSVNTIVKTFDSKISHLGDDYREKALEIYRNSLVNEVDGMGENASSRIMSWAKKYLEEVGEDLSGLKIKVGETDLNISTDFDMDMVSNFAEREDAVIADFMEKKSELESLRDMTELECQQLGVRLDEVKSAISDYDNWISSQNTEIQEMINQHQPQYITKESKLAKKLKVVGQVADVATLLIPVAGWEKAGVALAGKAGKLAAKGGKMAKVASKTLSGLGKGAEMMAKADKVMDASKVANAVAQKMNQGQIETAKKAGLFDYLSISYWMERAGESIDPTTIEIDKEFEEQYHQILEEKRQVANQKVKERLEIIKQKENLRDQIELHQKKQQLLADEMKKMEIELSSTKSKLDKERASAVKECYIKYVSSQFDSAIRNYSGILKDRISDLVDSLLDEIINAISDNINLQVDNIETSLTELVEQKKSSLASSEGIVNNWKQCLAMLQL